MSIEDNKNIVRRYQDAYNAGDFAALAEVMAADVLTPNIAPACHLGWKLPKPKLGADRAALRLLRSGPPQQRFYDTFRPKPHRLSAASMSDPGEEFRTWPTS